MLKAMGTCGQLLLSPFETQQVKLWDNKFSTTVLYIISLITHNPLEILLSWTAEDYVKSV